MSRMLSKMNLISVVQQLPKEDIETIQGYVEMIEQENQELKRNCNIGYKNLNFYREENQGLKNRIKEALNVLEEKQKIYSDEERIKQLEQENSIEFVMEILRGNY